MGLKENQVALYNEVEKAFKSNADVFFGIDKESSEDKGHGRICHRTCRVLRDLSKLSLASLWPGAQSVVEIKSETIRKGVATYSANYYIASSRDDPGIMMKNIRDHWQIESMHWMLDVVFREDASAMRKGNIPANMAIIRRFILNILSNMKGKRESRPQLMKMIGWSPDYLCRFINLLANRS